MGAIGLAILNWLRLPGNPRRALLAALVGYGATFAAILLLTLSAAGAAASNVWWGVHIVILAALTLLVAMLGGPIAAIQTMTGQAHGYWENGVFIHTPRILAANNDPLPPLRTTRITTFSMGWITFCLLAIVTPAPNWPAYLVAVIAATATSWWGYGPAYHGIFTKIARGTSIAIVLAIGIYEWALMLLPQTMGAAGSRASGIDSGLAGWIQNPRFTISTILVIAAIAIVLYFITKKTGTGVSQAAGNNGFGLMQVLVFARFCLVSVLVIMALVFTIGYSIDKAAYAHSNKPVGNMVQYSVRHMEDMFP